MQRGAAAIATQISACTQTQANAAEPVANGEGV
jgi:hypothetical protein